MNSDELIRKLRRVGDVTFDPSRGKGGHIRVMRDDRVSHIPTGSKELKTGLVAAILKQLGLTLRDLR
jgi:predicted RNA binding protein YcfA (HicA-like mRNA interferase family)